MSSMTSFRRIGTSLRQLPFDVRVHLAGLFALIAYVVYQVAASYASVGAWDLDWPAISALALLFVGVRVAAALDDLLPGTL